MEDTSCAASSATSDTRSGTDPGRGPAPAGISRLRQRRRRHPRPARSLHLRKRAGRIADLAALLRDRPAPGCLGISHTRWATHGPATDRNAHPHVGGDGTRRRRPQRRHRELRHAQAAAPGRGRRLPQRHRHRGHRPARSPGISRATSSRRCRKRRCRMLKGTYGLAVVSPQQPGPDRRRPAGQPAGRRHRRGRALPGQRSRPPWSATPRRSSTCRTTRSAS